MASGPGTKAAPSVDDTSRLSGGTGPSLSAAPEPGWLWLMGAPVGWADDTRSTRKRRIPLALWQYASRYQRPSMATTATGSTMRTDSWSLEAE
jgi:hypothetical protein